MLDEETFLADVAVRDRLLVLLEKTKQHIEVPLEPLALRNHLYNVSRLPPIKRMAHGDLFVGAGLTNRSEFNGLMKEVNPTGEIAEWALPPESEPVNCTNPIGIDSGAIIFSPMAAPEFVANKPQDRVWIWDRYIPEGGLTILCGAPKAGKSTLSYHLAKAIALGQPFLGFATKQSKVLIMALEEHEADVAARMEALNMVFPGVSVQPGPLRAKPEVVEAMTRYIKEQGIGLVIIDTLSTFWTVEDENNASQAGLAMDPILFMARKSGAAIFLLHHLRKSPGKNGEDIRGSSDVFAKADVALTFRRRGDQKAERELSAFSRYQTPELLVISLENGTYKALGSDYEVRTSEERERVLAALTLDYKLAKELAPITGLSESTCRRILNTLFGEGLIDRQGVGTRGKAYSYALKQEINCTKAESLSLGGMVQSNNGGQEPVELPGILAKIDRVFPGSRVVGVES
jgi:hypothetical protein